MLIPLPIPHPVHISIAIYNRDSEQPIPLDSEICWEILKAIEDCQSDIQVRFGALAVFAVGNLMLCLFLANRCITWWLDIVVVAAVVQ